MLAVDHHNDLQYRDLDAAANGGVCGDSDS